MTISSPIGYGIASVDHVPSARSTKSVEQGGPTAATISSGAASPPAGGSSPTAGRTGGVLSSINIAEILKVDDTPSVDVGTLTQPLGSREMRVAQIEKSREAYAAGIPSGRPSLTDRFTQNDVDTIRAATGYNVVVLNNLTTVVDDQGNPAPEAIGRRIRTMVGDIEGGRMSGRLTGDLPPAYLAELFDKYVKGNASLPEDWWDRSLGRAGKAADRPST